MNNAERNSDFRSEVVQVYRYNMPELIFFKATKEKNMLRAQFTANLLAMANKPLWKIPDGTHRFTIFVSLLG